MTRIFVKLKINFVFWFYREDKTDSSSQQKDPIRLTEGDLDIGSGADIGFQYHQL